MNYLEFDKKIIHAKICPYCGNKPKLVDSSVIYGTSYGPIYYCKDCDAYVGVHKGSEQSLGRLANKELRKAKKLAHHYFDQLWHRKIGKIIISKVNNNEDVIISKKEKSKIRRKARNEAYNWLSQKMELPSEYTHIGMFNITRCEEVIELCKPYCSKT